MHETLRQLTQTIEARKCADPQKSYVAKLLNSSSDAVLKKIGEEATELILAAKSNDSQHVVYEAADLLFHTMVMLTQHNLSIEDVIQELARREGLSGIAEKSSRSN